MNCFISHNIRILLFSRYGCQRINTIIIITGTSVHPSTIRALFTRLLNPVVLSYHWACSSCKKLLLLFVRFLMEGLVHAPSSWWIPTLWTSHTPDSMTSRIADYYQPRCPDLMSPVAFVCITFCSTR